jgi:hypothetical protein
MRGNLFAESLHQTRLADPRFTNDQHHLPFTVDGAVPAVHQQAQFFLPPDEGSKSSRRCHREPPAHPAGPDDAIELYRLGNAFQDLRAALFDHKQSRDEPLRGISDEHGSRCSRRLDAGGDIRRFSEHSRTCTGASTYHHRTRINSDPRG